LWLLVSAAFHASRGSSAANLLPDAAYLFTITLGTLTSWRAAALLGSDLVMLDWAGAMRLALRQFLGLVAGLFSLIVLFKDPGISRVFLGYYLIASWIFLAVSNRALPRLLAQRIFHRTRRTRTL